MHYFLRKPRKIGFLMVVMEGGGEGVEYDHFWEKEASNNKAERI